MRTLAVLTWTPFLIWLAEWGYNDLSSEVVGLGFVGIILIEFVVLFWALKTDIEERGQRKAAAEESDD